MFGPFKKKAIEKIIDLKLGVSPEAGVSGAVLVQSEYTTFLTFNAQKDTDEPSSLGGFYTTDAGTAIVEFESCLISKFGHPNDEAAWGIPKYRDIDIETGICEVKNSNWVALLEKENSYSFPNTDYSLLKHFLLFFHDSTFECVASDIKLRLSEQPYIEIISELGNIIAKQ